MDTMIGIVDAAEMIGENRKFVERLILKGELPGSKKLSTARTAPYLIPLKAIEGYIARQKKANKKRGQTKA